MQSTDIPIKWQEPWGKNAPGANIRSIPVTIATPGFASQDQGFPPINATPVGAGGIPPFIQDANGALNNISAWAQWVAAGGAIVKYDSTFQAAVGGYPLGAIVASASTPGVFWQSTVENNATNPDAAGAGWQGVQIGARTPAPITGATTTFTPAQSGANIARSNSGAPMSDVLPGTGTGVLPAGVAITVTNGDASALQSISAGAGATIKGVGKFVYLGPGQSATFLSDGANYWPVEKPLRARMAADATFNVATTGDDVNNNGLTASTPFLTPQKAWNFLLGFVDLNGFNATIQLADGTYDVGTSGLNISGTPVGQRNTGGNTNSALTGVVLQGNLATPTNVVITSANTTLGTIFVVDCAGINLQGFRVQNTSTGGSLAAFQAHVKLQNLDFGNAGNSQIAAGPAARVSLLGNYTISGDAQSHWIAAEQGYVQAAPPMTITLTGGTRSWSSAFAVAQNGVLTVNGITFVGTGAGVRFSAFWNGVIVTGSGANPNYFPGNAAGGALTGGQYV